MLLVNILDVASQKAKNVLVSNKLCIFFNSIW